MKPSQAELILRIAENTYSDGDEAIAEMRRLGQLHMQRVLEDKDLIAKAKEINEADQKRFAQYLPQQYRQEMGQGQAALGSTLAQQRAALPLRKTAE